jgi:predicted Zn-dependent peptidase
MRLTRVAAVALAAAMIPAALSCQKDEQEAEKFERADLENFKRDMSDLSSFELSNGITVYLQEEHTNKQIAIETLYAVGFMDEPKGRPQLSHLSEHLTMYCASGPFGNEEAFKLLNSDHGMVNAETLGDFIHFDYIVKENHFEDALRVEAARLGGITCDDELLKREQDKVISEIDKTLSTPKLALTKFAMMALNQAMNYGQMHVDIREGTRRLTKEEAQRFELEYFRTDNMVMIIIGDFKKAEAEALVRKHLEAIPRRPTPPVLVPRLTRDLRGTWDVSASAIYYIAPGPYDDYRERLVLSLFGSFLNQFMNSSPALYSGNQIIYCTNQVYRVAEMPFFLYAQPTAGRTVADVGPLLLQHLEGAIKLLDEDSRIDGIKAGATSFMTSSMLKPNAADYPMEHHQVIGQEALNVGMRHLLREGRTTDEFVAEVNAITPDQFRAIVKSRLARERLFEVTFLPSH